MLEKAMPYLNDEAHLIETLRRIRAVKNPDPATVKHIQELERQLRILTSDPNNIGRVERERWPFHEPDEYEA